LEFCNCWFAVTNAHSDAYSNTDAYSNADADANTNGDANADAYDANV
jgi:hypothetical protein